MKKFKIMILLIAGVFLLSSCATVTHVDLGIKTSNVVNVSQINGKSPIAVTIYQLSNDQAFNSAPYHELAAGDISGVLQQKTWVIWPNQKISQRITLDPSTKVIGIVAGYRDMQGKNWKTTTHWGWLSHSIDITINQQGIES